MKKKILAGIATSLICISLIGCGNVSDKSLTNKKVSVNKNKYEKLEGTWAEDYSLDEVKSKFDDLLNKVEEKTRFYGLDYNVEKDVINEDDKEIEKESYLYLDQENPEKNRLESLYFSLNLYGSSEEKGQISMKTSLNFNGEEALKSNKVKFEDTSLAAYAEIFEIEILKYIVTLNWDWTVYLFGGTSPYKGVTFPFSVIICLIYFIVLLMLSFVVFKKRNIKNI